MAEERLRRNFAEAYNPGAGFPDARLLGRTMAALEAAEPLRPRSQRAFRLPAGPGRQLIAATLIVLLLIAAAGAFLTLQHFFATPSTVWGGCGGQFQCATVKAPLDYSNHVAGSIDIAVIRKPATDQSHRVGSVVIAASENGVDFLRRNSAFYSDQFRRFDLVAFDERGFGRSSPVRCLTDGQIDALNEVDTVLDDPSEKQVYIQANEAVAQTCQQQAGRMLPFIDTASAARDMDTIRAALGETRITFLGFGYGTYLGQTYTHLYPTRVRAMALDGLIDPAANPTDEWRQRAAGYQTELDAYLASCAESASCALAQSGDPSGRLYQLFQTIDQNPLRVGSRALGRTLAVTGLLFGLDPHNWPQLDTALNDATRGDGAALLALADTYDGRLPDGTYSVHPEAFTAQYCVDHLVSTDVLTYDLLSQPMSKASRIFGPAFQYVPLACAAWHATSRAASAALPAPGAPPILLVGGTHDPFYTLAAAQAVHNELPGSVLLERDGYGVYSYVNSGCARLAMNAYL